MFEGTENDAQVIEVNENECRHFLLPVKLYSSLTVILSPSKKEINMDEQKMLSYLALHWNKKSSKQILQYYPYIRCNPMHSSVWQNIDGSVWRFSLIW